MKDVLEEVRALAAENKISFASDRLTSELDSEIQFLFETIYFAWRGTTPKRAIWVADGCKIGSIIDPPEAAREVLRVASSAIGIELSPDDLWEDAALRLRALSGIQPC